MTLDINNACCNIPLGKSTGAGSGGGGQVEWVTFPNAVILGEPVINGSQISGFTTTDYMMFPFILDVHDRPFEVNFSFTTGDDVTTQQNILDSQFGLALAIQNGHGLMAISNNGESWASTAAGLLDIMPNTTYYAKLTWNRLQYKTALSVDGKTFIDDMLVVNATRPYPRTMYIGGGSVDELGHTTHPFQGVIDMKNASLLVDGNTIWLGMDDPGLATRADVSLSNLDAAGEARFTAKQNKLTAMDGVMIEGNEISANVDGKTVKINGSGQLEAAGGNGDIRGVAPIAVDDIIDNPVHNMNVKNAATNEVYSAGSIIGMMGDRLEGGTGGRGTGISSYFSSYYDETGNSINLDACFTNGYILTEYKLGQILRLRNANTRFPIVFFGKMDGTKFEPILADPCPDASDKYLTGGIESIGSHTIGFNWSTVDNRGDYTPYGQTIDGAERYIQIMDSSKNNAYGTIGWYPAYGNQSKATTSTNSAFRGRIDEITHMVIIPSVVGDRYNEMVGTYDNPLRIDLYEGTEYGIEIPDFVLGGIDLAPIINNQPTLFSTDATEYTQVKFEGEFVEAPVIIDSYISGTSGYRVWSKDKTGKNYCEQWGHTVPASTNNPVGITLTKTYADNNYQVFKGWYCKGTAYGPASYDATAAVYSLATKRPDYFQSYDLSGWNGFGWRTVGYLAEGQYDV